MSLRFCLVLLPLLASALGACPKFAHVSFGNQVHISFMGEPKQFVPSSVYTVELRSTPFTEFMLTCEANKSEGSFQILNIGKTIFAEECINTIVEANGDKKESIQVLWTAPTSGCVNIKGAVKTGGVWLATNKILCSVSDGNLDTPEKSTCCACDHAKYKILFQGIWSPQTHHKDFPTSLWLTHFSDIIGASHTSQFSMWAEGQISTYGFKQLAEFGVIREMETELRNQSTQLRSIIKATGLWYPNLNGNTTAVFRVDPKRHLLTLASMFGPSPDWFVGVSALNLCLEDCTWIDEKVIDLFPYDAGTDDGVSYMSVNSQSDPPEKIRKITEMYPEDPRAPFYNIEERKMLPLAKLFIQRESIVPKRCSDLTEAEILEQVSLTENTEEEIRPECAVKPYSVWSECSVTCGKGIRMRTREYVMPEKSKMFKCDRQLVSKEMCVAEEALCPGETEDREVAPLVGEGECDVTAWSQWSDCSVSCGIGFIVRNRNFLKSEGQVHKRCMHISIMEKEKCMLPPCTLQEPEVSPACEVSSWSEWSPCSVTCGRGQRVRLRYFKSSNPPKFCQTITQVKQSHSCHNNKTCEIDPETAKIMCSLETVVGPCRGTFRRWSYNSETRTCQPFLYGGCRGNGNRFDTFEECFSVCGKPNGDKMERPINCVVSKWSNWSQCYPCKDGTKTKKRKIVVPAKHGGRECPPLEKVIKCSIPEEFCYSSYERENSL